MPHLLLQQLPSRGLGSCALRTGQVHSQLPPGVRGSPCPLLIVCNLGIIKQAQPPPPRHASSRPSPCRDSERDMLPSLHPLLSDKHRLGGSGTRCRAYCRGEEKRCPQPSPPSDPQPCSPLPHIPPPPRRCTALPLPLHKMVSGPGRSASFPLAGGSAHSQVRKPTGPHIKKGRINVH
jgi:hypothetical protein